MNTCVICLSNITNSIYITECNHKFHTKCLNQWYKYKKNCPICRCFKKQTQFEIFKDDIKIFISDIMHVIIMGFSIGTFIAHQSN